MLASVKEILQEYKKASKAAGAFNTTNLETSQAIIDAAVATRQPIVIQITQNTMKYAGDVEIVSLVRKMIEQRSGDVKIGLHLDHGKSFEICKKAIELGFNSVMIDGSQLSYEENKNLTKRVVDYAHKHNVSVQGELGTVPYLGRDVFDQDDDSVWDEYMTDPQKAVEFVKDTGVDTLAVAIGNAHGFQKERSVPDWERLEKIVNSLDIPLILHGSSVWTKERLLQAIKKGISCFNVDTDIRVAFVNTLCQLFENQCRMQDPRKIMKIVKENIQQRVEKRIRILNKEQ
ncbi:MAG: ketose-bisphosphate aldolase [Candidatus Moranbacteria bacterium]|nr:ketose-bisphosphate aldolase [Candidatus Moranbacteria bacterium]